MFSIFNFSVIKYISEIFQKVHLINKSYFIKDILGLKDVENALPQLSTASINVEFVGDPDWTGFEFITKKKGAQGPTKEECEKYYTDWYVSYYHSPYLKFKSS